MSRHANLTAGEIRFADPTQIWTPANFPILPSTALAITSDSIIEGRTFSTITIQNTATYEPYEQSNYIANKVLHIDNSGKISYSEPHPTIISTSLNAFDISLNEFANISTGAAGISTSDTLTNAIAKLDGWISHSLLNQPPVVSTILTESSAFYAGIRWHNFKSYNILNNSIPAVSAIVFILGDPSSADFLTLKLTNPIWFPDRLFTDGLFSDNDPIVRLRLFSSVFPCPPLGAVTYSYSKAVASKKCISIIDEAGRFALSNSGKVISIDTFPDKDHFTTFNIYLPNIPAGELIPVRIAYINNTSAIVNISESQIIVDNMGGSPSAVINAQQINASPSSVSIQISAPQFSDALHNISEQSYISSYNISCDFLQLNSAHSGNNGFRYGELSIFNKPDYITSNTLSYSMKYLSSIQSLTLPPITDSLFLPGVQIFNKISATNAAGFTGSELIFSTITTFPISSTPNISSVAISSFETIVNNVNLISIDENLKWNIDNTISSVTYLSSQILHYGLSQSVKFNDETYPGTLSNVILQTYVNSIETDKITLSSITETRDFPLNIWMSSLNGTRVRITDSAIDEPYQKFFYNIEAISEINNPSNMQTAFMSLTYPWITSYNSPFIYNRTFSTPMQTLYIDDIGYPSTAAILYTSTITNKTYVSGIETLSPSSELSCDIYGVNFAKNYGSSNGFAYAQLYKNDFSIGDYINYKSSMIITYDNQIISNLPLPQYSTLNISSCYINVNNGIYQNPLIPENLSIKAAIINPYISTNILSTIIGFGPFIDTISVSSIIGGIDNNRLCALIPRSDLLITDTNIFDTVGNAIGLNTDISSFVNIAYNGDVSITSSIVYNHLSTISTIYTNYYSRELIYTGGIYRNPNGLNYTQFSASMPNFSNDLITDINYGHRYAQFIYNNFIYENPISKQYINIRIINPNAVGNIITGTRIGNDKFPDTPIISTDLQYVKLNLYVKLITTYIDGSLKKSESEWINCLKLIDYNIFDETLFDIGGCIAVNIDNSDIIYKVQIKRREYMRIVAIVRIGIANDTDIPITFKNITATITD